MPRIAENTDSLLADLRGRMERLVAAARKEGRDEALADLRHLVSGGVAPKSAPKERSVTATATATARKPGGGKRKNPWASLSPEQRLARVNAIRKGRGLPLKTS